MRIDDLVRFGFSRHVVECWRNSRLKYLLPLQAEAVQEYGLLQEQSLLISGPTSSGKTFCGEMAAIKAVSNNGRALFLVPLKALASEKYWELKKRYRKQGIRVIIVTSDYPENKSLFDKGDYDIAVVVYEMFNSLTVSSLKSLETVKTVVFDEFQLVTTSDRGQVYETVIAKIRNYPSEIQLIGLVGGLNECGLFAKWLDIPLLKSTSRPVELHRGVLFNGKFSYRRYNDCYEGVEYFTCNDKNDSPVLLDSSISEELFNGVKYLVDRGEQALIFVATRNGCINLALSLANLLSLPAPDDDYKDFENMSDTLQKEKLMSCLTKGVGFHNADLSKSYRKLLEDRFRSGNIRVLVSTSTLAMGVNLPSQNVFVETVKYYSGHNDEAVLKPLLMYDYNQIAGRAGRLGQSCEFGRAIMIAGDDPRREMIWDSYIYGSAGVKIQPFDIEKLAGFVLRLICCGLIRDYNDALDISRKCLRGFCEGFDKNIPATVVEFLSKYGFTEIKGCRISCTDTGRAVAGHNIELDTAARIRDYFQEYDLRFEFLSWLFILVKIPEMRKYNLSNGYLQSACYEGIDTVNFLLEKFDEEPTGPLAEFIKNPEIVAGDNEIRAFLLLAELISSSPSIKLEKKYNAGWGRIAHTGERYANLVRAVADIGDSFILKGCHKKELLRNADCLYHGVALEGLSLARLNISMLERDFILRLNDAGIFTPGDVLNSGYEILSTLLPGRVADRLYEVCNGKADKKPGKTYCDELLPRKSFQAKKAGTRYEVSINGKKVYLQPRLYLYFHKLFNCNHPEGWIDKNFLDNGFNQVKYIYKLRKALAHLPELEIESDGNGRYRLVISDSTQPPTE